MNEPVPVTTILLEYAQKERRRWHVRRFLRSLIRPAVHLIIGMAIGAVAGLVLCPPVTYLDYALIRIAAQVQTLIPPPEVAQRQWQEYLATRSKALSILRDPKLAEFAFNACKPTSSSAIQIPDQLRGQMTIEDIPRTALIRIWIEDTDIVHASELLRAFTLEGVQRMQNNHILNISVLAISVGIATRDHRVKYSIGGAVFGGLIALFLLRPVNRYDRSLRI